MGLENDPNTEDLLSAIHRLNDVANFPTSSIPELHLFAESHKDRSAVLPQLRNIVNVTSLMALALSSHAQTIITDLKLVSLMRQKANISQELNNAESSLNSRLEALRKRDGVEYGEDIPSQSNLIKWFLVRIDHFAKSAGMEVFSETESRGKITTILAGKVIVLDIEFQVNNSNVGEEVRLVSLKSTHAAPVDAPATSTSTLPTSGASLDTFLAAVFQQYLAELQETDSQVNHVQVSRLGRALESHLQYIMKLDNLAQREVDGGSRWFTEVDDLSSVAKQVVPKEASTVAQNLGLSRAPLDILLFRGHALPVPYLSTPSLSFLVYLSPMSYLSLLRSSSLSSESSSMTDIPMSTVRAYFSKRPTLNGSVVATLSLGLSSQPSNHFPQTHTRPTFPLIFPIEPSDDFDGHSSDYILPFDNGPDAWILDFGAEGIVISQSRMWEIQILLGQAPNDSMPMMSFTYTGSWVDLLVQDSVTLPSETYETYEAIYVSPTNAHPPLQLRLTAPQEPGFVLRKIRVQSLRQIWSIFEIVKEQAWYNSLIMSHQWVPAELGSRSEKDDRDKPSVDTLLSGTHVPKRIPVSIYVESPILAPMFDQPLHRVHPAVSMVFPSKGTDSPLVNVSIKPDTASNYGIQVTHNGFPAPSSWTEVVRRGGGLAIAGRCWPSQETTRQCTP